MKVCSITIVSILTMINANAGFSDLGGLASRKSAGDPFLENRTEPLIIFGPVKKITTYRECITSKWSDCKMKFSKEKEYWFDKHRRIKSLTEFSTLGDNQYKYYYIKRSKLPTKRVWNQGNSKKSHVANYIRDRYGNLRSKNLPWRKNGKYISIAIDARSQGFGLIFRIT